MGKRNIVTIIILIVLAGSGYWGWQWKQTNDYTSRAVPLFNASRSLQDDLIKTITNGGRYIDIIDEAKRVGSESKNLKARLVEISTSTSNTEEVKSAMLKMLDCQYDVASKSVDYFRSDLEEKSLESTIKNLTSNPYSYYFANQINQAKEDYQKAQNKTGVAHSLVTSTIHYYGLAEKEAADLLGIALPSKDAK